MCIYVEHKNWADQLEPIADRPYNHTGHTVVTAASMATCVPENWHFSEKGGE